MYFPPLTLSTLSFKLPRIVCAGIGPLQLAIVLGISLKKNIYSFKIDIRICVMSQSSCHEMFQHRVQNENSGKHMTLCLLYGEYPIPAHQNTQ